MVLQKNQAGGRFLFFPRTRINTSMEIYFLGIFFVNPVYENGNIGQIKAKNDPGYGLPVKSKNIISGYKGKWTTS